MTKKATAFVWDLSRVFKPLDIETLQEDIDQVESNLESLSFKWTNQ